MKDGYIVINESIFGNEYFGVYKNLKRAERQLRKVVRHRFGHCPRDLDDLAYMKEIDDGESYKVVYFEENDK